MAGQTNRTASMKHASGIEEGLELIRVRQRRMGHVLWGMVPFVMVAGFSGGLPPDWEMYFVGAVALYGVLLLTYSWRLAFTECPRCENFYHWKSWSDPWTQRCLHCGLRLNEGGK